MKSYDIFLFDADGTLFDYDKAEAAALKSMFDLYGFSYSEDIRNKYREFNAEAWKSFENGQITKDALQTIRFSRLFDILGINCDPKKFNNEYLVELGKCAFLTDGAFTICKNITERGKKIYIVTNGVSLSQRTRLEYSAIKPYISDIFISEDIGFQKPNALYFDFVFSRIPHVNKDNFLIIGDSLSADIAGGINAGIDSCWFNNLGAKNETKFMPTYEIRHLEELNKLIL